MRKSPCGFFKISRHTNRNKITVSLQAHHEHDTAGLGDEPRLDDVLQMISGDFEFPYAFLDTARFLEDKSYGVVT